MCSGRFRLGGRDWDTQNFDMRGSTESLKLQVCSESRGSVPLSIGCFPTREGGGFERELKDAIRSYSGSTEHDRAGCFGFADAGETESGFFSCSS